MSLRLTRRAAALLLAGGSAGLILPPRLRAQTAGEGGAVESAAESAGGSPEGWIRRHGSTLVGDLKYPPDFPHFDFLNPDAPKGGRVRLGGFGSFDSFNPFIVKGISASGLGLLFDTLTSSPYDEISASYGLLAEWMEYPRDFSSVAFKIREEARWADGRPVTAADVIFSFKALTEKGAPFYRTYYHNVTGVEDLGGGVARFTFDEANNRELPHIMGQLTILPQHWWEAEGRDFARSGFEKLMGSGPYELGTYEAGRFVEYRRRPDYWAKDLPISRGQNNFDVIRYEYFLDDGAAFEAFKTGQIEFRSENSANNWATMYDFPALRRGDVIRREVEEEGPKSAQTFVMNTRRPQFRDRRVREAVSLAFDFEWTNKTLFHSQYARPQSYFQGSKDLMATGLPEGAELALLEPFRDQLPPELFTEPFRLPVTAGDGRDRANRLRATALFKEAGWETKGGKLADASGAPFKIEFLFRQSNLERILAPFIANLKQLGVDASLRFIDGPQYVNLVQTLQFDMMVGGISNSESPGNEQRDMWGSETADEDGTRNLSGVKNPVVDALIDRIVFAADREELEVATRALDRVLLFEHYNVLQLYTPYERIAYWKRLQPPPKLPPYSIGFPSIWWSGS
ncbi:extracellular solute-binding protein [Neomegalonema sp.]|uniref:extracellular solute-binding protein n=1 Tax=Neomegalonema sp. TaxID=2039713 RepID=UPI00263717A5|nr:extracellular solute-binding protein [Neomegalonema sp.]MDD2868003.1 extracellular solute-binding protein [Neomegalonema sp.]